MKIQWFWNRNFEYLMQSVAEWLGKNGSVTVVNTQFSISPDNTVYYWMMIYQ